ncbi:CbbQ/NirQ/NorQ/GpvN family protein [Sporichthya sp.]|uniref:CbbQ/NirQ/NorQ/GpvN family protein n=1 Tax=Sporichthya sp. TaxID=65475 RepID=UPI00184A9FA4|nr:CbbQ/NirQ/NorQ/GpvN family protein [Sporichthya sp.]MBA3743276.1 CbbQ/NirQ/NorQ/GpvN family protein [Sporichthya sp.]
MKTEAAKWANAHLSGSPYYVANGSEETIFLAAATQGLPVMLKGPTGCGKTRFVEAMAHRLGRPLVTVACHDDLTAADLVGRHLLKGGETVWVDGPLTRAVREGAMCYLDEVVEARQDTTVVLHPLADHRRELYIERLGLSLRAADGFMLVVSYNPGYQSVLKDLKDSTRQRMVGIDLNYLPAAVEEQVIVHESGISLGMAQALVALATAIRRLDSDTVREVASTRTLVSAARLIAAGVAPRDAAVAAVAVPLSDEVSTVEGLSELIDVFVPMESAARSGRSAEHLSA